MFLCDILFSCFKKYIFHYLQFCILKNCDLFCGAFVFIQLIISTKMIVIWYYVNTFAIYKRMKRGIINKRRAQKSTERVCGSG